MTDPQTFLWATGIEDTFITAAWPKTGRTLDEYELTGHYERWHADLGLMAKIGVQAARYGIPWHRISPRRGRWEWDFVDRTMDRLLELQIEPIVDLVHYGLPPWIDDAYLNPDFPKLMAEYASRVAERLKGRVHAYTPLNEPRITAWYCGRLGWWPPFQRGWRGFVAVMLGVCRGIVRTVEALQSVDPDILIVHVDATDLYRSDAGSKHAGEPGYTDVPRKQPVSRLKGLNDAGGDVDAEAAHRQEIVFLALDLVSGRIDSHHALTAWLLQHGATEQDLEWFRERAVTLPLIGINLYPMFTLKTGRRTPSGGIRWRMPYATAEIVEALGAMYWERYGAPVFISETASVGSVRRRRAWLRDSVAAVRRLRERGVPLVGYTWWPLFALVTWAYRQGGNSPEYYLKQMGLWDLDAKLERVPTELVEEFLSLARGGCEAVAPLNRTVLPALESTVH